MGRHAASLHGFKRFSYMAANRQNARRERVLRTICRAVPRGPPPLPAELSRGEWRGFGPWRPLEAAPAGLYGSGRASPAAPAITPNRRVQRSPAELLSGCFGVQPRRQAGEIDNDALMR